MPDSESQATIFSQALSDALTRLLTDMLARLDGAMPNLNYVCAGGHHPTEYFQTVLSPMVDPRRPGKTLGWKWIIDDYHACQMTSRQASTNQPVQRKTKGDDA